MNEEQLPQDEQQVLEQKSEMKKPFSFVTSYIVYVVLTLFLVLSFFLLNKSEKPIENNSPNGKIEGDVMYTNQDKQEIQDVFTKYVVGGADCNIEGAQALISQPSKELMHFTCSNYKSETACHITRDYEILVHGNEAIIHFSDFSVASGWPYFFIHETDGWKIDFYKMAHGIAMGGSGCASGWTWTSKTIENDFCSYFPDGNCPERI